MREDSDISQEMVAHYLSVAQRTYSSYERGVIRIPTDILIGLAKFYDVDLNYICGITDLKEPYPNK